MYIKHQISSKRQNSISHLLQINCFLTLVLLFDFFFFVIFDLSLSLYTFRCSPVTVSAFTDYIKGLSPSALDLELRMLQIVDEDNLEKLDQRQPELQSIGMLLDYLIHEISCRNNFEFIQAVIKLFLKVHIYLSHDFYIQGQIVKMVFY